MILKRERWTSVIIHIPKNQIKYIDGGPYEFLIDERNDYLDLSLNLAAFFFSLLGGHSSSYSLV